MNVPGKEIAKALAPLRNPMIRVFEQTEPSRDETLNMAAQRLPSSG